MHLKIMLGLILYIYFNLICISDEIYLNVSGWNTITFHFRFFRLWLSPECKISKNYDYNNIISYFAEMKTRKIICAINNFKIISLFYANITILITDHPEQYSIIIQFSCLWYSANYQMHKKIQFLFCIMKIHLSR